MLQKCVKCNEDLSPNNPFCEYCGTAVSNYSSTNSDDIYSNNNTWMTKPECELVIKECDQELEKNPNNETILREKIRASIHLKKSAKFRMDGILQDYAQKMTASTFHKLIDMYPTKKNLEEAAKFFEDCLFSGTTSAVRYYDLLLKIEPGNIEYMLKKAAVLQFDNEYRNDAVKCYDDILQIDPNNYKALTEKADTCRMIGQINEELLCYEKLLKLNPDNISILLQIAKTLYVLDRHENALQVCEMVLKMNPNPDENREEYLAVKLKEMILQTGQNKDGNPICPKCQSEDTGYFVHGPPSTFNDELDEDLRNGKIRMAGCVVMPNSPTHFCNKCEYEWGAVLL